MIAPTQTNIKNSSQLQVMGGAPNLTTCVANSVQKSDANPIDAILTMKLLLLILTKFFLAPIGSAETIIGDNITVDTNGSISIGSAVFTSDYVLANQLKAAYGFKDLNRSVWQLKLNYSADLALVILESQEEIALALINSSKNESLTHKGESRAVKYSRINTSRDTAVDFIDTNKKVARATIEEARLLALLNSETLTDLEGIAIEVQNQSDALNATAILKAQVIKDAANASIAEIDSVFDSQIMSNFTKTIITTNSNTDYTNILTLPLNGIPAVIECDIISNASANTVGIQYWSNITGASLVYQFVEYYDGVNSQNSEWSENASFNLLPTSSSGTQLHTTHFRIYTERVSNGNFTLSVRTEVLNNLVTVRPPSFCEMEKY